MYVFYDPSSNFYFQSSDEENDDIKKDKPRPRLHSSTARKQLSIQESKIQDENESRERTTSECISGNESDFPKGKYRKVTRLSSDQIVRRAIYSLDTVMTFILERAHTISIIIPLYLFTSCRNDISFPYK